MKKRLLITLLVLMALVLPLAYSPPVSAASFTYYTSSSDATLSHADTNYATTRTAASCNSLVANGEGAGLGQVYAGGYYGIYRFVLYFDTSSLPDGAVIVSATLGLYGYGDNSDTDFDITIQNGMPTYPHNPAVNSDYNYSYYSGNGGSLSTTSFATAGYNEIELNTTGLSWINDTGYTKFMLRSSRDIAGNAPTGVEAVQVYLYEKGSGYRPYLEITYVSAPDITTNAASSVSGTTARLNANVVDDGGEPCEVRWGWGESSEAAIEDYDYFTSFAGSYTTNQKPYYDVDSLDVDTLYYFCVEIHNSEDTDLGSELSFTTTSGVNDPTNFLAYPSATSVSLSWSKGAGATNSVVRYRTDDYPATYTDGTLVYEGTSSSCQHTDLTPGTTYYYAVWCYSGAIYSSGSAEVMVTTSASTSEGDGIETPGSPWHWLTGTDYTRMSNLPLNIYDAVNGVADFLNWPRATFWMLGALLISMICGFGVYGASHGSFAGGLGGLTVSALFFWAIQLLPLYMPILGLIATVTLFMVKKREVYG